MKILIVLAMLATSVSFAGSCKVKSKYSELTDGLNKDTICADTLVALFGSSTLAENATLIIEANAERGMYYVVLNSIKYKEGNEVIYNTRGVLHWYPGDSYVILEE